MELGDTINLMLDEIGQQTFKILNQGTYTEKMAEYFHLEEKLLKIQDTPDLQRYIQLALELRETERNAAQITGMQAMVKLYQLLSGEDKKALLHYCEADFEHFFEIVEAEE